MLRGVGMAKMYFSSFSAGMIIFKGVCEIGPIVANIKLTPKNFNKISLSREQRWQVAQLNADKICVYSQDATKMMIWKK